MPRCKKWRCCRMLADDIFYKPAGIPLRDLQIVQIGCDEFEAIRILDIDQKSQIEAAHMMKISRGTVQRLLQEGRYKIAEALMSGKAIQIEKPINQGENP